MSSILLVAGYLLQLFQTSSPVPTRWKVKATPPEADSAREADENLLQEDDCLSGEDQLTGFRFLDLPGEMRNIIYRYDLLNKDHQILIDNDGFQRSNLLRASKQIRAEGLGIFYMENQFYLDVHDFDTKLLQRWNCHLHKINMKHVFLRGEIWVTKVPSWRDFLIWMRRLWDRKSVLRIRIPGTRGMGPRNGDLLDEVAAFLQDVEPLMVNPGRWRDELIVALLEKAKARGFWQWEWFVMRWLGPWVYKDVGRRVE